MNEELDSYYLATTAHESVWPKGVILWWAPDQRGYSTTLNFAGRYTKAQATGLVNEHTFMVPVARAESASRRIVDLELLESFKR